MVTIGKRNKRISLHQKYKVAKKVRQHNKKVNQALKKQKPKREKPSEIPNDVPFKAQILKEIEESKLLEKELQKKRLIELNKNKNKVVVSEMDKLKKKLLTNPSSGFVNDLNTLITKADVIIQVLDARDPNGTRSLEIEKEVKSRNKTLVFVLNKIDMVPLDNVKAWIRSLSKEARVFPLKSICVKEGAAVRSAIKDVTNTKGVRCYGVEELLKYLKSLGQSEQCQGKVAAKLVVGVVGLANSGKSSLINSLKMSKKKVVCEAGSSAELTRQLQYVDLDNSVILVDCPATVMAKSNDYAELVLRNCVRVDMLESSVIGAAAAAIVSKATSACLRTVYMLGLCKEEETFEIFIQKMASEIVNLKKGGQPNFRLASLKLINDWNSSKIAHCSKPPAMDESMETDEGLISEEQEKAMGVITLRETCQEIESTGPLKTVMDITELGKEQIEEESAEEEDGSDEEDDEEEEENVDMDE